MRPSVLLLALACALAVLTVAVLATPAAQVEIVTERRSLLSLFLKPFEALLKGDMTIEK